MALAAIRNPPAPCGCPDDGGGGGQPCDWPNGFARFTFTIEELQAGASLAFTNAENNCGGIGNEFAYIITNTNRNQQAELYAQYIEATGPPGTQASSAGPTVTILVPIGILPCGTQMQICTYNSNDNPGQDEPLGTISYPNGQAMECCPGEN